MTGWNDQVDWDDLKNLSNRLLSVDGPETEYLDLGSLRNRQRASSS